MVRRIALLAFATFAVFLIACGGDEEPRTASQLPEPTARPTRAATGPTAIVEPRSGPPGDFVTVSGAAWPPGVLIDVTGILPAGTKADPYATTTTDQSGAFSVRFRLEKTPDGADLQVGRFDLIVRSASAEVDIPFLVETRRPIQNNGPG
ncbi:MAG TPA: hypothetical protein VFS30_00240 [Dehalococcoidia bacterium]|nr:hypothetical protein [Dehalococcoidia bacterium]